MTKGTCAVLNCN